MWQMKFKFVVQSVWRRRKELYYAVSVISIAGNLVVFVGPSLQSSIVLRSGALHAAWSVLPQVAELVLHRSMLYILLNLIVARIVVKSGVLGRTTPGVPAKVVDDFGLPSSCYVVRGSPWAATNSYSVYETQTQLMPGVPMFTDPSMWLQQARMGEDQNTAAVDARTQTPAPKQPTIKKSRDNEQAKSARAPSLFTIEPLDELVQTTDSYTLKDDQAQVAKTLKRPLRKVASRRADLHRSTQARAGTTKDSRKAIELAQRIKDEQSMQLVLAKQGDGGGGAEDEDNRLSGQEFFERVETYIIEVKRRLTMQRQESLNRLLGGGDIRLIK